ncbi:MAG: hypothetical protein AAGJ51_10760 [Pseudomonadota bacterium]
MPRWILAAIISGIAGAVATKILNDMSSYPSAILEFGEAAYNISAAQLVNGEPNPFIREMEGSRLQTLLAIFVGLSALTMGILTLLGALFDRGAFAKLSGIVFGAFYTFIGGITAPIGIYILYSSFQVTG